MSGTGAVPEGPCDRCLARPAETPEGLCGRCVAQRARWQRAQAARRRRAAGEKALPTELRLGRSEVNGLAAALRTIAAANDVVDAVSQAQDEDHAAYGPYGVENALYALSAACDDALALLRHVLPPEILPPPPARP